MRYRRWTPVLAVGVLVIGSVVLVHSGSAAAAPTAGTLRWQPCTANTAVDCAGLTLPIDRSQPDGPTFNLAVARHPAADPAHRIGTLIYAPAGPGSSGVQSLTFTQEFNLLFPASVANDFDIVSFDPRGVGGSDPVLCDASLINQQLSGPDPTNQAQFAALLTGQAAVGANCQTRTGPMFDHLDSRSQARDLDALRDALGESSINLYALSYGTVLGQMYAEMFPRHIRTMILDGNVDHSVNSDQAAITGALAAQETFEAFIDWCNATTSCELHGKNVKALVDKLFAEANSGTLPDPDNPGRTLDASGLNYDIFEPDLSAPLLTRAAHEIAVLSGLAPASPPPSGGGGGGQAPTEQPLPIYIQCADFANATTTYAKQVALLRRERAVAPDVQMAAIKIAELCINPPFPVANPPHRLSVHGAPPILVMNSRYDTQTPYQAAQRVAAQIPGAELVTYDGIGHGVAIRSACTETIVFNYLADQQLPPPGTHCANALP